MVVRGCGVKLPVGRASGKIFGQARRDHRFAQTKMIAPVASLPTDLLASILQCESSAMRIVYRQVNRTFRACIDTCVVTTLDMRDKHTYVDEAERVDAIQHRHRALRKLVLLKALSTGCHETLPSATSRLESLTLHVRASDIRHVSRFRSLHELQLILHTPLRSLSPLTACVHLRSLSLVKRSGTMDVSALSVLVALTTLSLPRNMALTDLVPIAHCVRLTSLDLSYCSALTHVQPLSSLTRLRSLSLKDCCRIGDVSPLIHCTALTDLDLSYCTGLSGLPALGECRQLHDLCVVGCQVLSVTSFPTSLRHLDMSYTASSLPSAMSVLTQLDDLRLRSCHNLTELTVLSHLISMVSLEIETIPAIQSLAPLLSCTALTALHLRVCGDLPLPLGSLSALPSLHQLIISHSHTLEDMSPLTSCTALRYLGLKSCPRLRHVAALQACTQLTRLIIRDCHSVLDASHLPARVWVTV